MSRTYCLLFLFFLCFDALADGLNITLQDAVFLARKDGLPAKNIDLNLSIEADNINQVKSSLLPKFSFGMISNALGGDAALIRSLGGLPTTYTMAAVRVEHTIYSNEAWSNYIASKEKNSASHMQALADLKDIDRQVIFAYLDVLRARSSLVIAQKILDMSERSLSVAKDRVSVGLARSNELYRWETQIASDQQRLYSANMYYSDSVLELNKLINISLSSNIILHDVIDSSLVSFIGRLLDNPNLINASINTAMSSLPELKSITQNMKAQNVLIDGAKRGFFMPTISARAEAGSWFTLDRAWEASSGVSGFSESFSTVTIGAMFPIDIDGLNRATLHSRAHEMKRLQNENLMMKQRVEQNVRAAINGLLNSHSTVQAAEKASKAAEKNLLLVNDSYRVGEVGVIEVIDAQTNFANTELKKIDASYGLFLAYVDFEYSIGIQEMADIDNSIIYLNHIFYA